MKRSILKSLFIYLLLVITGIGSNNSFGLNLSYQEEEEVLQQDDHTLPLFSEEIQGPFLLQVISGKQTGNQGKITAFFTPSILRLEIAEEAEPSVYLQFQKLLLKQHIFPFHFFW